MIALYCQEAEAIIRQSKRGGDNGQPNKIKRLQHVTSATLASKEELAEPSESGSEGSRDEHPHVPTPSADAEPSESGSEGSHDDEHPHVPTPQQTLRVA